MQIIKLRSIPDGNCVKTTIFQGLEGQTLVNCGVLTQTVGEWQIFGALLLSGAANVPKHVVEVILEGTETVIDHFRE